LGTEYKRNYRPLIPRSCAFPLFAKKEIKAVNKHLAINPTERSSTKNSYPLE
jgi:hypothetical protein